MPLTLTPWTWPWPHDLDTRTWPRYYDDISAYQKCSSYFKVFKCYNPKRLFDLDLDPMTLIPKHDLDRMKIYQYTKNEVSSSRRSNVITQRVYLTLNLTFDLYLLRPHFYSLWGRETMPLQHFSSCCTAILIKWICNIAIIILLLNHFFEKPYFIYILDIYTLQKR